MAAGVPAEPVVTERADMGIALHICVLNVVSIFNVMSLKLCLLLGIFLYLLFSLQQRDKCVCIYKHLG